MSYYNYKRIKYAKWFNAAREGWEKAELEVYDECDSDYDSDLYAIAEFKINQLEKENSALTHEVEVLRRYGNKDCTAMADDYLKNGGEG